MHLERKKKNLRTCFGLILVTKNSESAFQNKLGIFTQSRTLIVKQRGNTFAQYQNQSQAGAGRDFPYWKSEL